jgi:hypothetical protein
VAHGVGPEFKPQVPQKKRKGLKKVGFIKTVGNQNHNRFLKNYTEDRKNSLQISWGNNFDFKLYRIQTKN